MVVERGTVQVSEGRANKHMTSKLRILLADDHETVREGLRMILNAQPDMQVVATAGDGREAIRQAETMTPDVVIMDISMPGLNGLAATVQLTEKCPAAKVLTLTRHADSSYLQQLMRAGAAGYVLKQSRPAELLHAIRSVATGNKYLDSSMTPPVVGRAAARRDRNRPHHSARGKRKCCD